MAARHPTWLCRLRSQGSPSGGGGWHNLYSLKEKRQERVQLNRWNPKTVRRIYNLNKNQIQIFTTGL